MKEKKCRPCEGIGAPLTQSQAEEHLKHAEGWQMDAENKIISRTFTTKHFMAAVEFINKIAKIAEAEDHHPDIHLINYRELKIDLTTHAIGGLSENDFILASKINALPLP